MAARDAGSRTFARASGVYALYRGTWYAERGGSDDRVRLTMSAEELSSFVSDQVVERQDRGADSWVELPRAAVERFVRATLTADWRGVQILVDRLVDGRAVILMHQKPENVDDVELWGNPFETGGWSTTVPVGDLFDVREEIRDLAAGRELRLLDTVAEQLTSMGLGEDVDFYIPGRRQGALPSSEHVGMAFHDDAFRVWYRDMGRTRELLVTSEFTEARTRFIEEATRLAAGRGRGPEAPGYDPDRVAANRAVAARVKELFDGVADELDDLGLADTGCFYLPGHGERLRPGPDWIGMSFHGKAFHVWRRNPSGRQELLVSTEFAEARRCFLDEGARLAARDRRGVGGARSPSTTRDATRPPEERRRFWRRKRH